MHPPDASHWLYRLTPRAWIQAALGELDQARGAFGRRQARAGMAGCRRAAGVAINGYLASLDSPPDAFGRTYMEHLAALEALAGVPQAVREAARSLLAAPLPGGPVVPLRTPSSDDKALADAQTVMAWAYAQVLRMEPPEPGGEPPGKAP
ncbi:MAG: hypothetical protein HY909_16960 [Deltaproteobacteria bacterium]|nr:hypothetical protein [Deltaproteobacteria bacterium]